MRFHTLELDPSRTQSVRTGNRLLAKVRQLVRRQGVPEPPAFGAAWGEPEERLVVLSDTNQFDWRKKP